MTLKSLRSGCVHLAQEITRARPKLAVFGHRFDDVRRVYEGVIGMGRVTGNGGESFVGENESNVVFVLAIDE